MRSTGLIAWDISELTFDWKRSWTVGVGGDVAEETLTYKGGVYPVAEVNYLIWGLVNRLAYEDGIQTNRTDLASTIAKTLAYRSVFGGMLITNQWYEHYRFDDDAPPLFETISGKAAWTAYGYEWAVNDAPRVPIEESLINAKANNSPWPRSMSFHAGGLIDDIVP